MDTDQKNILKNLKLRRIKFGKTEEGFFTRNKSAPIDSTSSGYQFYEPDIAKPDKSVSGIK